MHITVTQSISMGHRLPTYDGVCSSLHSHNIRVDVGITTRAFLDFKVVSERLRDILEPFDHAMVLHNTDPVINALRTLPGQRLVMLSVEPTTENLASYIYQEMRDLFHDVLSVTVYETDKYSATCSAESTVIERWYEVSRG